MEKTKAINFLGKSQYGGGGRGETPYLKKWLKKKTLSTNIPCLSPKWWMQGPGLLSEEWGKRSLHPKLLPAGYNNALLLRRCTQWPGCLLRQIRGSFLCFSSFPSFLILAVLVTKSCPTLWPHRLWPARLLCPWLSPGKNTWAGCHFLLQRIFPIQGSNPGLLHW